MRRRSRSRAMTHAGCCESCENPLTTFTTEQALYLAGGGIVVASFLGYLLYNAGKNAQRIIDLTPATVTGG
jgi:hypothetical protein